MQNGFLWSAEGKELAGEAASTGNDSLYTGMGDNQ